MHMHPVPQSKTRKCLWGYTASYKASQYTTSTTKVKDCLVKSILGLSHHQLVVSRFSEVYAVRADKSPAGEETFGEKQWE